MEEPSVGFETRAKGSLRIRAVHSYVHVGVLFSPKHVSAPDIVRRINIVRGSSLRLP